MNATPIPEVPLHILMRRRRQELSLTQADLAEELSVTAECISQWEAGRRRMELSRLPHIGEVLKLDPRELCAKALAEFYPLFHASLFGERTIAHSNTQRGS